MHVYKKYNREDELCQTNGHFSLNLTLQSVNKIKKLLELDENSTVGWIGCGDGRELFCIASEYPQIQFEAFDINASAILIANRVLSELSLKNVKLHHMNVMQNTKQYTHVYSTAISGPELYAHLHKICTFRLCMLRHMWDTIPVEAQTEFVKISGSGEQRQLVASNV